MARWCVCSYDLVLFWACLAIFIPTQRCDGTTSPLKCDPGYYRVNATAAACSRCPDGKYMDTYNEYPNSCQQCKTCTFPSRAIVECNSTRDTVCECRDGYYMSVDGCAKITLVTDHNPVMNLTSSVQRIEEILGGLQSSLNETHSDVIRQISGELRKLNETFFSVLHSRGTHASKHSSCETAKLSNATTDIAEVIQRTNITTIVNDISEHQSRIWTLLSGEIQTHVTILVIVLLAYVIIVLLLGIWKEQIYDCFCGRQCCRKENGSSNGRFSYKGYMPLDIKVSKIIEQIRNEICGQDEGVFRRLVKKRETDSKTPVHVTGLPRSHTDIANAHLEPEAKFEALEASLRKILAVLNGSQTEPAGISSRLERMEDSLSMIVKTVTAKPEQNDYENENIDKNITAGMTHQEIECGGGEDL